MSEKLKDDIQEAQDKWCDILYCKLGISCMVCIQVFIAGHKAALSAAEPTWSDEVKRLQEFMALSDEHCESCGEGPTLVQYNSYSDANLCVDCFKTGR